MSIKSKITRRHFIVTSTAASGGLVIGFYLPGAEASTLPSDQEDLKINNQPWMSPTETGGAEVNAWLVIFPDDTVTIRVAQSEMGEGVFTAMPMIVAEELHCDWNKVQAEYASANRSIREGGVYKRMATNGSGAVRRSRRYLQQAGASARERLIQAAADRWQVPATTCTAKDSIVTHTATGKTLRYGEIAHEASTIQLPEEPTIKTPEQFTLLGTSMARLDTPLKVNGSATFGIDIRLPDMLYATSKTSPIVGAKVKSYNFNAIKNRPGIHSVVEFKSENKTMGLRSGVAVVADTFWRAKTALELLPIEWDYGANSNANSKEIAAQDLEAINNKTGTVALNEGNALENVNKATKVVEAIYSAPHQAHATMEPLGCTAQVTQNRVDLWLGTQDPEGAIHSGAEQSGVAPENVHVNNCFLGGGFGGRGSRSEVNQAVAIAKTLGGRPVNLVWTREEDIKNDYYNPSLVTRFQAGLGSDGMPLTWFSRSTGDSILFWHRPKAVANGIDPIILRGLSDMPYQISNKRVEYIMRNQHIPVSFWRAPGVCNSIFMIESFIDELAHTGNKDPVEFRGVLLENNPNWLNVLNTAADKANWGQSLPPRTGQGIAICVAFGTIVAQVAQVSVSRRGELTVEKVVCALDCGHVINPLTVEMQVESCVVYGLSAALYGEITVENGAVVQKNFDDYPMLKMKNMPEVETHLALSGGTEWGGIGEASLPSCAPAVANAVFAATGKRMRSMPFKHYDLSV